MTRILLSFPTSSPFIEVADCCSNFNPRNQNEKDLSPLLKDMREFSLGLGLHHDEDSSPAFLRIVSSMRSPKRLVLYPSRFSLPSY